MSPHQVVIAAFVAIGCVALLLSVAALVALPDALAKVHALAPASTVGGPAIAVALAIEEGVGRATVKFVAIAVFMAVGGTAATMATGALVHDEHDERGERGEDRRTGAEDG